MPRTPRAQTEQEKALGLASNEFIDPNGYIRVRDHTRVGGSVLKHRLVMERHLGRPLKKDEQVRFVGSKLDMHIKNLRLVTTEGSRSDIVKKIQQKRRKIQELEQDIEDLKAYLRDMEVLEMTPREAQLASGQIEA
jgi:hypothetical protein